MLHLLLVTVAAAPAVLADSYTTFEDVFARDKMLPMSAAAYSDDPQPCLSRMLPGSAMVHKYSAKCDYFKDICFGFIAISPADQAIIIAYRGSQGAAQIIAEIQESAFDKHVDFVSGGKVSLYFNNAFMDIWNAGLKDSFQAISKLYPNYQLWITGHSLGGSMASLTASFIVANNLFSGENIRLVTFGQPRTGDKDYADHHDQLVPHSFRVTHYRDIVPHIPPEFLGFHHHSNEIFYPNDMSSNEILYKTCGSQEDDKCSDGYLDFSIKDHLHYFQHDISEWGESGCQ